MLYNFISVVPCVQPDFRRNAVISLKMNSFFDTSMVFAQR